jgi:hypothetical protein
MISFKKKPDPQPSTEKAGDNRFEQIRKTAAEQHEKSDADAAARRTRKAAVVEDDKLI